MTFSVSPAVTFREIDTTGSVVAVTAATGAIGGVFRWGPVGKYTLVEGEGNLVLRYGAPTNYNAETWFTGAGFLGHSNQLYVSRAANTQGFSAISPATANGSNVVAIANGGGAGLGLTVGMKVYGEGVPDGTVVVSSNTTAATLSANVPAGSVSLVFASGNTPFTAIANTSAVSVPLVNFIVPNEDVFEEMVFPTVNVPYVAKYQGELGNSLRIAQCDSAEQFSSTVDLRAATTPSGNTDADDLGTGISYAVGSRVANVVFAPSAALGANTADTKAGLTGAIANSVIGSFTVGDKLEVGDAYLGKQFIKIKSIGPVINEKSGSANTGTSYFQIELENAVTIKDDYTSNTAVRNWEFFDVVNRAPRTSLTVAQSGNAAAVDELHVVVVDELGKFRGVPGQILEVFEAVSRCAEAKTDNGSNRYYRDVINDGSLYVWSIADVPGAPSGDAATIASSTNSKPTNLSFKMGSDGDDENNVSVGALATAYDLFLSEDIDIAAIMTGKARGGALGEQLPNYILDNIVDHRRDTLLTVSPNREAVVGVTTGDQEVRVVNFFNLIRATSYAVSDSNYKYTYDKYNDVYRYVPCNGDTAGLIAKQTQVWRPPAGYERGQFKNLTRFAHAFTKGQRDYLYKNGVNPTYSPKGQGHLLFGDKTLLRRDSDFEEVGIRRLFMMVEKAVATWHQRLLFEFNDTFTRTRAKNATDGFLEDIQGQNGVEAFLTDFSELVNTPEVVNGQEFRGKIYIKGKHSINWITLDFIAVRSGVEFSEIVGQV